MQPCTVRVESDGLVSGRRRAGRLAGWQVAGWEGRRACRLPVRPHGTLRKCHCAAPLAHAGSIAGKLAAGNTSWVPASYVRSQQDAVKRFFQQNGYIGYDTVGAGCMAGRVWGRTGLDAP